MRPIVFALRARWPCVSLAPSVPRPASVPLRRLGMKKNGTTCATIAARLKVQPSSVLL